MKKISLLSASVLLLAPVLTTFADGPADNSAANVRPVPPPGKLTVSEADRSSLEQGLKELQALITDVKKAQAKNPQLADLLPDVEIFYKSVDWALRYNYFNDAKEIKAAREQIEEGKKRATALKVGETPWTKQKGLVVRAYRSKIDGSIQPYGMVIPDGYSGAPTRMDFWIHGRGETLSELSFVDQRMKQVGQITPRNALVLHLYGRYCCANKIAGEVDLFEALAHAKKFYHIDEDRIVVRGFSMGGASAWQFGTHFASQWCAVNPGAGFAETPEFLNVFQNEDVSKIPSYQKKLWHLYNSSEYALNLANCPTIAYSGEIDKQKQAADVMERELKKEGLDMLHIIGPQTAHKIHPDSLVEIERRLAEITRLGRDATPREVHFTTWTLRYNQMAWITVDGMGEEWQRARVDARLNPIVESSRIWSASTTSSGQSGVATTEHNGRENNREIEIHTQNVTAMTLNFESGHCPLDLFQPARVVIDGTALPLGKPKLDRSFVAHLVKNKEKWEVAKTAEGGATLAKRHGLQGPIDDAYWDAFLYVTPTGPALNPAVDQWVKSELPRAVREWQKQFRGDAPQKKDNEINDADIKNNNLILWGDPSSNAVLKKIAAQLPIKWTADAIEVSGHRYGAGEHVPLLIYPNPLNHEHYVVINSGITYREYDYLNNARQVPKLPDWAIVNLSEAPNAITPGKVVSAGFFDEKWMLKGEDK